MKKLVILLTVLLTIVGLSNSMAQNNVLSDKFDADYFSFQKLQNQVRTEFIQGITKASVMNAIDFTAKIMKARMECARSVENEYDYIMLYCDHGTESALMALQENDAINISEKAKSEIKILWKMQKDYDKFMYEHKFFQSAFNFFKEQMSGFSFTYDITSDNYQYYQPAFCFKKNLNDYSLTEIFWILEFSEQFLNRDTFIGIHRNGGVAIKNGVKLAAKMLRNSSGFPPFKESGQKWLEHINL